MVVNTVLVGSLHRDYLLPPTGRPLLDVPGGSLLYAAAGAMVWRDPSESGIGLLGRVGEDYPQEWLQTFQQRGFSVEGIQTLPGHLDVRSFIAFSADGKIQRSNPVSYFARLGLQYPKSLLGYQSPLDKVDSAQPPDTSPRPSDIPGTYQEARAAHFCPLDHLTLSSLIITFNQLGMKTITVDPSADWMVPEKLSLVRELLHGLTAFFPSEEELRSLFWGKSNDLWEMVEGLQSFGCEFIVVKRGMNGQYLFDPLSMQRWEIPAYPARIVDPTGAGDSFCGGFLAEYSQNYDPLRAVLYGNVSASLTVEGSGSFYALETLPGLAQARVDSLASMVRKV